MNLREWLRTTSHIIPDRQYLQLKYYMRMKKRLNLNDPQTFNEKLQWLKLYDRNPLCTKLVDKYEVRTFIEDTIGERYLIPLLGVWDSFDEIDFSILPNQFVLKCTHNSGGVFICKDKEKFDIGELECKVKNRLKSNYFYHGREWPYKDVKPRLIAEQYMTDHTQDIVDYKIHCMNGDPRFILVCKDRFSKNGMSEDFFSTGWRHLDVRRPAHPNSITPIDLPPELPEMLEISRTLSRNICFARIDLYALCGRVYFGEVTLFPASGFTPFIPQEFDEIAGQYLNIGGKGVTSGEERQSNAR